MTFGPFRCFTVLFYVNGFQPAWIIVMTAVQWLAWGVGEPCSWDCTWTQCEIGHPIRKLVLKMDDWSASNQGIVLEFDPWIHNWLPWIHTLASTRWLIVLINDLKIPDLHGPCSGCHMSWGRLWREWRTRSRSSAAIFSWPYNGRPRHIACM